MSEGLELRDSRVSRIEWADGTVLVRFSHARIHKANGKPGRDPGTLWSQEAALILWEAIARTPLPTAPSAIAEGSLEVGGISHEPIPLPFKRKLAARLALRFADGTSIEIVGKRPAIELLGTPIFLGDFS